MHKRDEAENIYEPELEDRTVHFNLEANEYFSCSEDEPERVITRTASSKAAAKAAPIAPAPKGSNRHPDGARKA